MLSSCFRTASFCLTTEMASLVRLAGWATGEAFMPETLLFAHEPEVGESVYRERLGMAVALAAHP